MKTPVNSIMIPERFVAVCADWYGGSDCMLYAIASTGGLTTGTIRPAGCSDEEWYYTLWRDLFVDVHCAVRAASAVCADGDEDHADHAALNNFENWVGCMVTQLCDEYGLADWDG